MHKAHRSLHYRSTKTRSDLECHGITSCKNQDVLEVPPLTLVTIPKTGAHYIEACTAVLLKEGSPVIGPLLVDMIGATLPWYRRGEEKEVAQRTELGDERTRPFCRKVLGDFKTHCEIEMLVAQYLGEPVHLKIAPTKKSRLDHEATTINVIAIEADCPLDAEFQRSPQPRSDAATNIND
jgi:hypothetical protein